ncbi:Uncharacterised protein [uncultured archaeon]|nr:Uncharacterised protein [uncultured archaeon]
MTVREYDIERVEWNNGVVSIPSFILKLWKDSNCSEISFDYNNKTKKIVIRPVIGKKEKKI